MSDADLPTVSVIVPTRNSGRLLPSCLEAIRMQDYPPDKVEVLVMDGGSTDATVSIARQYGAKVTVEDSTPRYRDNAEARMALGLAQARHDIVAYIMSDNILPYAGWLRDMVRPLTEDASIVGTQTLRYAYRRTDPLLCRYFALLGAGDPVAYYLNKRDRISWAETAWAVTGAAVDKGPYYRVEFRPEGLPPMGCNGALIRREPLLTTRCSPDEFGHSDVVYELVTKGHRAFGVVKNDIIHYTDEGMLDAVRKRMRYFRSLRSGWQVQRQYLLYDGANPRDRLRLGWYILLSMSFVKPLWDAARGYRRIRDVAWFVHPVFCFLITLAYGATYAMRAGEMALRPVLRRGDGGNRG